MHKFLIISLLSALSATAQTTFWQATMSGQGLNHKDDLSFTNDYSGNEAFSSPLITKGFANIQDAVLVTNEAALRTSFEIDPTNRTLKAYSYTDIFQNPVGAESFVLVGLRDYYIAESNEPLTIRVRYEFSDWNTRSGDSTTRLAVWSQAYNTGQTVYPFHGRLDNMMENLFETGTFKWLDQTNSLGFATVYCGKSEYGSEYSQLENFDYEFTVSPGTLVAIDTLTESSTMAGGWLGGITGRAYAGTQNGPAPFGMVWQTHDGQPPEHYVRYTVEVLSGEGTFHPYTTPAPIPPVVLNPGSEPGKLRLQLAGESGTGYVVETSTNLVDWTYWFTATGTGTSIVQEIDTSLTNSCFYRITPKESKIIIP